MVSIFPALISHAEPATLIQSRLLLEWFYVIPQVSRLSCQALSSHTLWQKALNELGLAFHRRHSPIGQLRKLQRFIWVRAFVCKELVLCLISFHRVYHEELCTLLGGGCTRREGFGFFVVSLWSHRLKFNGRRVILGKDKGTTTINCWGLEACTENFVLYGFVWLEISPCGVLLLLFPPR